MQATAKPASLHVRLAPFTQLIALPVCVLTTPAATFISQASAMPTNVFMAITVTPRQVFAWCVQLDAQIALAALA